MILSGTILNVSVGITAELIRVVYTTSSAGTNQVAYRVPSGKVFVVMRLGTNDANTSMTVRDEALLSFDTVSGSTSWDKPATIMGEGHTLRWSPSAANKTAWIHGYLFPKDNMPARIASFISGLMVDPDATLRWVVLSGSEPAGGGLKTVYTVPSTTTFAILAKTYTSLNPFKQDTDDSVTWTNTIIPGHVLHPGDSIQFQRSSTSSISWYLVVAEGVSNMQLSRFSYSNTSPPP